MDLIRHGVEHVLQKLPSRLSVRRSNELSHSELAGAIDANEQVELALSRLSLCDINMKESNRVALELLTPRLVPIDIRQAGDPVPLKASMQRRSCQMRDRRLQGIETIVKRQQRMTPESDDCRFFGLGQNRGPGLCRSCLHILDCRPLPPLRHGLEVDAQFLAQLRERSLRSLYCCSDGVRGRGAAVTNLSHNASFHS